ncbi:MAG: TM0106 family RecB-like putative nuclease [Acidimicrobiia bacterium]
MRSSIDPAPRVLRAPRLGGGDIGVCLTKIHLDRFTPTVVAEDPVRDRLIEKGRLHEGAVIDTLIADRGSVVCRTAADIVPGSTTPIVVEPATATHEAIATTLAAIQAGADLIFGGRLAGRDSRLVGAPDVLVRLEDGYAAVDIKSHLVVGDRGMDVRSEELGNLGKGGGQQTVFRSSRRRDLLQVAHYWRLLDAVGHASSRPVGGIVGSDQPTVCLWADLDEGEPSLLTTLDRYLAEANQVIDHGATDPEHPLVASWWRGECKRCSWQSRCLGELESMGDPTLLNGIALAERIELSEAGVRTIADVANLDVADSLVQDADVVAQARAKTLGMLLWRSDQAEALPMVAREVDFDIETINGQIYLAGFLITEDGASVYDPIVDWSGSAAGEAQVVASVFERFADYGRHDTALFHWTSYEERILTEAAARHGASIAGYSSVADWFAEHAIDLWDWTRSNLVSPNGYGLKVIAPLCGFEWRDDDPGGLQSEMWFEALLDGNESMKGRLLAYNEDDVIAQREVRRYVRSTVFPSVQDWPITQPHL